MKKIKLPRKRKKAFIKAKGRGEYYMAKILKEILAEEDRKHAERFFDYGAPCKPTEHNPFHYVLKKRW